MGLDPRVHFWRWEEEGARLLVRPGPAGDAARRLMATWEGSPASLELLTGAEPHQVSSSWTSLRSEPRHESEQTSQLRLGQAFSVWARDVSGLWCLGAGADGYPGWLRAWHLEAGVAPEPDHRLVARQGQALSAPRPDAEPLLDLPFACALAARGKPTSGFLPWQLPDGRAAWTAVASLARSDQLRASPRECVLELGPRLTGVPYEWGGTGARGFDCSGLVQALLAATGLVLPRDADLQAACGRALDPGEPGDWRPGDLLFFGDERIDHVGILLPARRLLHASGEVQIETLDAVGRLPGRPLRQACNPYPVEHDL